MTEAITILLVDDHEVVRKGVRAYLETQPDFHVVGEASSGEEAIDFVTELIPDVVLMDLIMPGMDGIELLQRVREQSRQVPVILCTAYGEYKQNLETWASDEYIVKSANLDGLMKKIEKLLKK